MIYYKYVARGPTCTHQHVTSQEQVMNQKFMRTQFCKRLDPNSRSGVAMKRVTRRAVKAQCRLAIADVYSPPKTMISNAFCLTTNILVPAGSATIDGRCAGLPKSRSREPLGPTIYLLWGVNCAEQLIYLYKMHDS